MARQRRSGKTAAAFCQEQAIRRAQFFWWKRQLREEAAPAFIEMLAGADPCLELRLGGGRSLWLRPGFDAELLRQVLRVLEEGR